MHSWITEAEGERLGLSHACTWYELHKEETKAQSLIQSLMRVWTLRCFPWLSPLSPKIQPSEMSFLVLSFLLLILSQNFWLGTSKYNSWIPIKCWNQIKLPTAEQTSCDSLLWKDLALIWDNVRNSNPYQPSSSRLIVICSQSQETIHQWRS